MKKVVFVVLLISLCIGSMPGCRKQEPVQSADAQQVESLSDSKGPEQSLSVQEVPEKVPEIKVIPFITHILREPVEIIGKTYYVSSNGNEANAGTEDSPWTLKKANAEVQPGDTVILLDGTYRNPIKPARSGKKGNSIVYKADNPRKAVLTGTDIAVLLNGLSYISIEGIDVKDNVRRFIEAIRSHHITLHNGHFENAKGAKVALFYCTGDGIRVTDCFFKGGGDLLWIAGGSLHLIENNTFGAARHTGLVLMGTHRSVVRGNIFNNPLQKTMEVFTMNHGYFERFVPERFEQDQARRSMYVLIENNRFDFAEKWAGIQYCGNRCILRRNVFRRCGYGMSFSNYPGGFPEAVFVSENRFYNNVIMDCGSSSNKTGIGLAVGRNELLNAGGQIIMNNIIFGNRTGERSDVSDSVQIMIAGHQSIASLLYNNIFFEQEGQPVISLRKHTEVKEYSLTEYQEAYPEWAHKNIETDPLFVDPDKGDFSLKPDSPCVDAAGPLTLIPSSGKGTKVTVQDALFFSDGYGVVEPDIIRIGPERVTIVKVDYEFNQITVDRTISWEARTPVSLDYSGYAPDIGAFEFQGTPPVEKKPALKPGRKTITLRPETYTAEGGGTIKVRRAFIDVIKKGKKTPYISDWDFMGHWVEWTVPDAAPGRYNVVLYYAARKIGKSDHLKSSHSIWVNGKLVKDMGPFSSPGGLGSFTLPATGGWDVWKEGTLPAPIHLKQGVNVIRMEVSGGNGLNVALITLVPME